MLFLFPWPLAGNGKSDKHCRYRQQINKQAQDHVPYYALFGSWFYLHDQLVLICLTIGCLPASLLVSSSLVNHKPPKMMMKGTSVTIMPTSTFFPKIVTSDTVIRLVFNVYIFN
jgi:hypothetical protein